MRWVAFALILALTSCGSARTLDSASPNTPDSSAQPAVEVDSKVPQLGSPAELLKTVTAADGDRFRLGAQYMPGLPNSRVAIAGEGVRFFPQSAGTVTVANSGPSYAMYVFPLPHYDELPIVEFAWLREPQRDADWYIGLGNQLKNRWDWYEGTERNLLELNSIKPYQDSKLHLLLTVMVLGREPAELSWVRWGGNLPPVVELTADPPKGVTPLVVTFDASGSYDLDGRIVDFEWDFDGDGQFSASAAEQAARGRAIVKHTYVESGGCLVNLRVTDNGAARGGGSWSIEGGAIVRAAEPIWEHTWGASGNEQAADVAIGPDGDIYITGSCEVAGKGKEILTMKLDGVTRALCWAKTWGVADSIYDNGQAIAVDGSGNVYVTGITGYPAYYIAASSLYPISESEGLDRNGTEMVVLKYSPGGNLQWAKHLGEDGYESWHVPSFTTYSYECCREDEGGYGIAVDSNGNVYVTGQDDYSCFGYQFTWIEGISNYYYAWRVALVKLNPDGEVEWQRGWGKSGGTSYYDGEEYWKWFPSPTACGFGVALDEERGLAYVTGYHDASSNSTTTNCQAILACWDMAGNLKGAREWGSSAADFGRSVAVDSCTGRVYVTGETASYGQGNKDVFLLSVSPFSVAEPSVYWQYCWGGSNDDMGDGIVVDIATNRLYLAGSTKSFGAGGLDQVILSCRLDDGALLSDWAWGGVDNEQLKAVVISASYNLPLAVGYAPCVLAEYGGWQGIDGYVTTPSISWEVPPGGEKNPSMPVTTVTGNQGDYQGVWNEGGGGTDVFLAQCCLD